MNDRTEGIINSLAAILVLFTAMLDPRVSVAIAVVGLAGLAIYRFRARPSVIRSVKPDAVAARHRQIRVIDESGEDYLFPASWFALVELPAPTRRAVMAAV